MYCQCNAHFVNHLQIKRRNQSCINWKRNETRLDFPFQLNLWLRCLRFLFLSHIVSTHSLTYALFHILSNHAFIEYFRVGCYSMNMDIVRCVLFDNYFTFHRIIFNLISILYRKFVHHFVYTK